MSKEEEYSTINWNSINTMIKQWIESYGPKNIQETEQALREIMKISRNPLQIFVAEFLYKLV